MIDNIIYWGIILILIELLYICVTLLCIVISLTGKIKTNEDIKMVFFIILLAPITSGVIAFHIMKEIIFEWRNKND